MDLKLLKRESRKTFGDGSIKTFKTNFWKQRKNAARKLKSTTALNKLPHFSTPEFHKTHDMFHVQRLLGRKCIQNTSIYINLESSLFLTEDSQFHSSVAEAVEEARRQLEAGFEYA